MSGRYLVTGCAGFIGSAVAQLLTGEGGTVVGVDNINDAYDRRVKLWRLDKCKTAGEFSFAHVDICNKDELDRVFHGRPIPQVNGRSPLDTPFDTVFHLAARAGVRASVEHPDVYFRTNVEGTLNILENCRASGVRKLVLASTSSLYGASNELPYSEDSDTSRPLSPYAASKKGAEALCHAYHYLYGIDTTIFRYFTVYGPAGRPDMSVFRFVRQIAEGQPITVYGDGSQRRDFTFVEDIARGTVAARNLAGFDVINLGSDQPVALRDVIHNISRLVDREAIVRYEDAHPADVPATWASIKKAGELLRWRPQVDLKDGLRSAVDWYRENREWVRLIALNDEKSPTRLTEACESVRPIG